MFTSKLKAGATRDGDRVQESLEFLHKARPVQGLRPAEVEWIARHLSRRGPRPGHRMRWPALAALGLALAIGATIAAAKGGLRSLPFFESLLGPPPAPPAGQTRASKHGRKPMAKPEVQSSGAAPSSLLVVPPAALPSTHPLPDRSVASAAAAPPPLDGKDAHPRRIALQAPRTAQAPAVSPLRPLASDDGDSNPGVQESRSFALVIEAWHRAHDANTTLRLLGEHEQRYPRGIMRLESQVLRADVYLTQGREREALSVLDALSLTGIPRARELQTTRGELRIKVGRCADGKRDLNDVLTKGLADAPAKRAVEALSRCP